MPSIIERVKSLSPPSLSHSCSGTKTQYTHCGHHAIKYEHQCKKNRLPFSLVSLPGVFDRSTDIINGIYLMTNAALPACNDWIWFKVEALINDSCDACKFDEVYKIKASAIKNREIIEKMNEALRDSRNQRSVLDAKLQAAQIAKVMTEDRLTRELQKAKSDLDDANVTLRSVVAGIDNHDEVNNGYRLVVDENNELRIRNDDLIERLRRSERGRIAIERNLMEQLLVAQEELAVARAAMAASPRRREILNDELIRIQSALETAQAEVIRLSNALDELHRGSPRLLRADNYDVMTVDLANARVELRDVRVRLTEAEDATVDNNLAREVLEAQVKEKTAELTDVKDKLDTAMSLLDRTANRPEAPEVRALKGDIEAINIRLAEADNLRTKSEEHIEKLETATKEYGVELTRVKEQLVITQKQNVELAKELTRIKKELRGTRKALVKEREQNSNFVAESRIRFDTAMQQFQNSHQNKADIIKRHEEEMKEVNKRAAIAEENEAEAVKLFFSEYTQLLDEMEKANLCKADERMQKIMVLIGAFDEKVQEVKEELSPVRRSSF